MKPILTHLHIFYPQMWEELKNCLKNIDRDYDLYVTMVEEHKNIIKDILSFKSDAKIEIVENRGFDVGPFVHIINKVNLDNYEYIIKLHTKRDVKGKVYLWSTNVSGRRWRNYLLSFIKTERRFNKSIKMLQKPNIGMISDYRILVDKEGSDPKAEKELKKFLSKNNMPKIKFSFVAGTMFIAKASVFKPLQGIFNLSDFAISKPQTSDLAHIIERLLGYLVYYKNQEISAKKNWLFLIQSNLSKFLYFRKITNKGKLIIKICKIPVYSRRVK